MAKKKKAKVKRQNIKLLPIYIMAAFVPIIVYMKRIKLTGILYETWRGFDDYGDFFSYYKAATIITTAFISILILILSSKKPTLKSQKDFIPITFYFFFALVSTILSEHIQVALWGFTERHEGFLVIFSYLIMCFYTAYIIEKEEEINKVVLYIGASCVIIGIIGLFQYFGKDLFQTEFGMELIIPPKYHQYIDNIKFSYEKGIITSTLYNPNYVGSYSCMLLLVSIGYFYKIKDIKGKIITGILFCGFAFVLWIGSMSRAGMVGGSVGLLVFVILHCRKLIKEWKFTAPIAAYLLLLYFLMNITTGGKVAAEFDRINPFKESKRIEQAKSVLYVEEIKAKENLLFIKTSTEALTIIKDDNSNEITFVDANNTPIETDFNGKTYKFKDDAYTGYEIRAYNDNYYDLKINDYSIRLKYENGFKRVTPAGQTTKIENAEQLSILKGRESFASGRGFIWSRSVPMIKQTIIKGHGPDTYAIYFPQWDLAGKINGLRDPNRVVDTPHNMYLQIAIDTGLISLIAFLLFLCVYAYNSVKNYIISDRKEELVFNSAVLCAIINYCVAGLFNDSVVSVAPVFWVLLGLGIAQNRILKKALCK